MIEFVFGLNNKIKPTTLSGINSFIGLFILVVSTFETLTAKVVRIDDYFIETLKDLRVLFSLLGRKKIGL